MIPIDTKLIVPLNYHYVSTTFSLFCDYFSIILLLIFYYIAIHNIMLPYKLIKTMEFIEGESLVLK
jgi:hypothetical protein